MNEVIKDSLKFFLRGVFFITPIGVTVLLFLKIFSWFEEIFDQTHLKGVSLLLFIIFIFLLISLIGYLGSTLIASPVSKFIEKTISKIPLFNFVYSSIKDLTDAFIGNKKKFDKPVLVNLNDMGTVQKLGFITQEDLTELNLPGKVVVYLPHSYAFSGNMYIVHKTAIQLLDVSSSECMKFIVSAGVAGFSGLKNEEEFKKDSV